MKTTVCVLLTCIVLQGFCDGSTVQFGQMIQLTSRVPPLSYNGYGNYCGIGGKGHVLDPIDRCCRAHDRCLKIANRKYCLPIHYFAYYIMPYYWNLRDGKINCAPTNSRCSYSMCECDRLCAECFGEYDHKYDPSLKRRMVIG